LNSRDKLYIYVYFYDACVFEVTTYFNLYSLLKLNIPQINIFKINKCIMTVTIILVTDDFGIEYLSRIICYQLLFISSKDIFTTSIY